MDTNEQELMKELVSRGYSAMEIAKELDKLKSAWRAVNAKKAEIRRLDVQAKKVRTAKLIRLGEVVEKRFGLIEADYFEYLLDKLAAKNRSPSP